MAAVMIERMSGGEYAADLSVLLSDLNNLQSLVTGAASSVN